MNSYDLARHFADSWGLAFMVILFVSFIAWTFRRSARAHHDDAAAIIFRDDENE